MLEFAIVALVFFTIVLGTIDFARIYSVQAVLTKGAQNGLALAKVIDGFRVDVENLATGCPILVGPPAAPDPACIDKNYADFLAARDAIIQEATRLPLATFASVPASGKDLALHTYQVDYANLAPTPTGGSGVTTGLTALVLRPSDTGKNETKNYPIEHPQICPTGAVCSGNRRPRRAGENLNTLFRNFPIVVQVEANLEPFLPFLDPIKLTGKAVGYRETNSGTQTGQLPDLLACVDPPICAPGEDLENCGCVCNLTCGNSPLGVPLEKVGCEECVCPATYDCDYGNQVFDPDTCDCGCFDAAIQPPNQNTPYCQANNTPYHMWNGYHCECKCNNGALRAACRDQMKLYDPGSCSCLECPTGPVTCEDGEVFNPEGCTCDCIITEADCTAQGLEFDEDTCSCGGSLCPEPLPTCTFGNIDYDTCECLCGGCPGGVKVREEGCGFCVCPDTGPRSAADCNAAAPAFDPDNCVCFDPTPVGGS